MKAMNIATPEATINIGLRAVMGSMSSFTSLVVDIKRMLMFDCGVSDIYSFYSSFDIFSFDWFMGSSVANELDFFTAD